MSLCLTVEDEEEADEVDADVEVGVRSTGGGRLNLEQCSSKKQRNYKKKKTNSAT